MRSRWGESQWAIVLRIKALGDRVLRQSTSISSTDRLVIVAIWAIALGRDSVGDRVEDKGSGRSQLSQSTSISSTDKPVI